MRHPRMTPQRRSLQMLAFAMLGLGASATGVLVAAFADRNGTTASSAIAMSFLLGASMCTAGLLHFLAYDEQDGKGVARIVAVVAILGYIALIAGAILWFSGGLRN